MNSKTHDKSKISSKAQVVIPLNVRNKMGLKTGDILSFRIENNELIATKVDINSMFDRVYGSMPGVWGNDPVKTIRKQRNDEWR